MKRLFLFLALGLMLLVPVQAVSAGAFHYENKAQGISITVRAFWGRDCCGGKRVLCELFPQAFKRTLGRLDWRH